MTHNPPPAEELRLLDAELWRLDARRAQLLARRARLLASLQQAVPLPPAPPAVPAPPRPETSAPGVQNVLLLLGGVLLTVAAIAFTLVGWGELGIAGRSLVLGTATVAVLATPVALLRRGLRSTSEAVAGLGLALTVLDAYALHEVALPATDGTAYTAVASAVLAGLWAAYARVLGRPVGSASKGAAGLRLPLPCASAAAQLTLPLGAVAATSGTYWVTAALLVTAALDMALALRTGVRPLRITAAVGAYGAGGLGVLQAGWLSGTAGGLGAACGAGVLVLLAAATALTAGWRLPKAGAALGHATAGGLLLVVAFGGVLRVFVPGDWLVPALLACGVALLAALGAARLPGPVRHGLLWASGLVQGLAALWALPLVIVVLAGPLTWLERPWSGVPADARAAVTPGLAWPPLAGQALVVLAALAAVLALAVRDAAWRARAMTGSLALACAVALAAPAVLGLPYAVGLLPAGAMAVAAFLLPRRETAVALSLVASVHLALLALASRGATLTVLPALTVLFAVAAWRSRTVPVTAPVALGYGAALAGAAGAAAGWAAPHTALLVMAVPAVAALLAARLGDSPATVPVEATGAAAGAAALGLAVTDRPVLALVLGLCGVITAATAVRPGRREAGYAAAVLFVLATWVRLAAWEVTTPEAYTLPVAVPALLVGVVRRRRDATASSWTAYGPGIAAALAPSLLAVWGDPQWQRPLLLGAAALLVTLLGARHHLQAPLVLGGVTLALTALHELAPYLVQLAGALPRWAPPALAGALLLALGATYERRIRDVRRVREVLGRMG
ncbi:hypothetical protein [Streptomyces sp. NPDC006610]|uniref:SCO7613 C-terminal domain-containing membrane protein n=1 Tax=Streptomyces sp. NPDC006610 TaxID=3154584 RepID=UPI0033A5E00E